MIRLRGLHFSTLRRLLSYRRAAFSTEKTVHVFFCIGDHYEPDVGGASSGLKRYRVARWVREYLQREEPNGKDDNDNGLIDEPGLSFDVIGEVWTIRITLELLDPKGHLLTHTAQTSIKTRN